MKQGWPLTGRDEELDLLGEILRGEHESSGVLLAGAAGVGKTRLAREALAGLTAQGRLPRWAVATASARNLPLGAFAHLVALPHAAADAPDPNVVLRVATESLLSGAQPGRVVVGVDDAHLLDDLSATLVHHLALSRTAPLVVTVRSGEPAPDAVTALWKDGYLRRFEVQPLSEGEMAVLVESVLDGPLESASARRLYQASQGNVLFLRQLVDGALSAGNLKHTAGVWQWRGSTVTPQLAELVEARIGRLPAALHDVLELLAFDEPLGVRMLAGLTSAEAVEEAERHGLVSIDADGQRIQARLAHPLYEEVLRGRTSSLRARRLRGRLAEALAAMGARRSGDTLRLAALRLDSDTDSDPVLMTSAARQALALFDLPLAERLAQSALRGGGGLDASAVLGNALSWQGRPDEAEQVLAPLVDAHPPDDKWVRVAFTRAANLFWTLGRAEDGERVVNEAIARCGDDRFAAELRALRSCFAVFRNRPAEAAAEGEEVLAAEGYDSAVMVWAAVGRSMALGVMGRTVEALALIGEAAKAVERYPDAAFHRVTLGYSETMALLVAGRLADAERVAARDFPVSGPASWGDLCSGLLRGQVALGQGRPATAVRWCTEAVAGFAGHDPADWTFMSSVSLAQAVSMVGDAEPARQTLADTEAAYRPSAELLLPDLFLARAWVAAAEGAVSEARSLARHSALVAGEAGQYGVEVMALHAAVCFGDRTVADRLAELAGQVDGERAPLAADHAAALAADDGALLDTVSQRWEALGAQLLAADAAAQASAAHHRRGRRSRGISSAARAADLAERCENARTPALRTAAQPLPLSVREREVADLAAAGLSNREIAERLVVSVRTVEGHIYHVFTKLGVADRVELATLLRAVREP